MQQWQIHPWVRWSWKGEKYNFKLSFNTVTVIIFCLLVDPVCLLTETNSSNILISPALSASVCDSSSVCVTNAVHALVCICVTFKNVLSCKMTGEKQQWRRWRGCTECQYQIIGCSSAGAHVAQNRLRLCRRLAEMRIYYRLIKLFW